jgi:hypothetical protein
MAQLEHPLGEREILEAVHAKVLQRGALWQVKGGEGSSRL